MTAPFTTLVRERSLWGPSDFTLVDVGASGGIARRWDIFGERLAAVGFDPLIAEVERLNGMERRPKVRYVAARVGWPRYESLLPVPEPGSPPILFNQPYGRTSAVKAHALQQHDYVRQHFNAGSEVAYAETYVSLDIYFAGQQPPDFIKIDTDGHDYAVLLGADSSLKTGVLGVEIEVQFHGAAHEYANVFSNIDPFLRHRGFSLFDLRAYRYSRAALPAPFRSDILAQTTTGQIMWAEAVYFRDPAHEGYERTFDWRVSREQLMKLCCLFELYGLPDCAAELLEESGELQSLPGREELLDSLTPRVFGPLSYREYMRRFEEDPARFLPSRIAAEAVRERPPAAPKAGVQGTESVDRVERLERENARLLTRVRELKDERQALRDRLKKRAEKLERLQAQLQRP